MRHTGVNTQHAIKVHLKGIVVCSRPLKSLVCLATRSSISVRVLYLCVSCEDDLDCTFYEALNVKGFIGPKHRLQIQNILLYHRLKSHYTMQAYVCSDLCMRRFIAKYSSLTIILAFCVMYMYCECVKHRLKHYCRKFQSSILQWLVKSEYIPMHLPSSFGSSSIDLPTALSIMATSQSLLFQNQSQIIRPE